MKTHFHETQGGQIAEVVTDQEVVRTPQEALDLFMSIAYQGARKIILPKAALAPEFFDLKTRLAGEILQKVINYQLQLAIVGDFSDVQSDSMRAFITESNRGRQIFFFCSFEEARTKLERTQI